jgi:hypothetical protein
MISTRVLTFFPHWTLHFSIQVLWAYSPFQTAGDSWKLGGLSFSYGCRRKQDRTSHRGKALHPTRAFPDHCMPLPQFSKSYPMQIIYSSCQHHSGPRNIHWQGWAKPFLAHLTQLTSEYLVGMYILEAEPLRWSFKWSQLSFLNISQT